MMLVSSILSDKSPEFLKKKSSWKFFQNETQKWQWIGNYEIDFDINKAYTLYKFTVKLKPDTEGWKA